MTLLTVGSVVARPGEKISGYIEVPEGVDPATRIPVTIATGTKPGPVLALIAGIHGSEPSPILALQRVRRELDVSQLAGTVIIVHIANLPSFTQRTIYRGPWDQKNLNRMFPGSPYGTVSERIAFAITTQVIDQCDCLIDMHSGDGNESLRPYAYWNQLGVDESVDARARDLALAFGLDHIVIDRNRPRDSAATVFCSNTAHVHGKPAVTTEAGGVGVPTEDMVELNVRGAFRVMRHLEMLPGPRELVEHPVWIEPSEVLSSPDTGTWHPLVQLDQHVEQGALLGYLTDYFGERIADVRAPIAGIVMYVVVSPAMGRGEPVAMVGVPSA
ncbi:MAG: N-alpha-acetyl-L-2,4-diaminobutyric acid deacetylase [Gemmatimonadetes bacterium]|nr:N-alpha-acetyl-L-2,4-diaminobutyric acid deacetylase [Gemmatimonadota bacterium]